MTKREILLVAVVISGWSFPGVFVHLMPQLDPLSVGVFRLAIGFLGSLPFLLSGGFRPDFLLAVRRPICWGVSLFMFAYYLTATSAFLHAPVSEVALLISSAPAIALPLRLLAGQKPTSAELLGTALAIGGVCFILTPAKPHAHYPSPVLGPVLALSAAFCAAAFTVGVRHLSVSGRPASPFALSAMAQSLGLLVLPLALVATPTANLLDTRSLWTIPLGLLSTAIPTAGYAAVAGRLSPIVATMLNPLVAVSASVVAALAIGEQPRIWVVPGAVLIIAGIYVAVVPPRMTPHD